MTDDPDKQLLERCLQGDAAAWDRFIRRFSPLVYYAIQKVVHAAETEADEIADLHNDIFLSLMENAGRKLRQYEGKNGCSVSTWIRVIAIRASIDHLKKKKRTAPLHEAEVESALIQAPQATDHLVEDEEKRILKQLIDELPPGDQLFLRLLYYEEVSCAEIARLFRTTPNAVYSRGNYLREKLKEALRKKICKDGDRPSSIKLKDTDPE